MTAPFVFWTAAFGTSEAAVRMLPCLASLLTLVVVYRLGRRLGGPAVGLVAASVKDEPFVRTVASHRPDSLLRVDVPAVLAWDLRAQAALWKSVRFQP